MKQTTPVRRPKPAQIRFDVASSLLATGQRLRKNETVTATTFALTYAAKWAQATGGRYANK